MRELRRGYLDALRKRAVIIEQSLRLCEARALTPEARERLRDLAHKLAGTGATYGYADLSARARVLDNRLKASSDDDGGESIRDLTSGLLVTCRNVLGLDDIRNIPNRKSFGRRSGAEPSAPEVRRRRPKLLVVDDDPAVRDVFITFMADGCEVVTAENSDEALDALRRHRPDLVLLDDIMPGAVTGLKFLERLQASGEFADTPIIMLTASDAPEHIERGFAAGAADYITKPFDARQVVQTIRARLSIA